MCVSVKLLCDNKLLQSNVHLTVIYDDITGLTGKQLTATCFLRFEGGILVGYVGHVNEFRWTRLTAHDIAVLFHAL